MDIEKHLAAILAMAVFYEEIANEQITSEYAVNICYTIIKELSKVGEEAV